jgi:hypothetical protein
MLDRPGCSPAKAHRRLFAPIRTAYAPKRAFRDGGKPVRFVAIMVAHASAQALQSLSRTQ